MNKIYCDSSSGNVCEIIKHTPLAQVKNLDSAELIWCRNNYKPLFNKITANQLLNHIPTEGCIVNKGKLYASLQNYANENIDNQTVVNQFLQPSYRLYEPNERRAFLDQLPEVDTPENLWILKPATLSKGIGARVVWQFATLKKEIENNKGILLVEGHGKQQYVAQKYIKNPLLLNNRKSEIRIYWLIASLDPLLVLLYSEGTVRLNTLPFKLDDFDNQLIHITNVYQQKKHPDYDPDTVLKWRYSELQQYLLQHGYTKNESYLADTFMPQCLQMIRTLVSANITKLRNHKYEGHHFGLYGADIIIDDQLTPWLTEVQKGPGLSHDEPVKRDVIPAMLSEALSIMFEIHQRKINQQDLTKLETVARYQWVINES